MLKEEIPKLIKSLFSRLETKLDQSDADIEATANTLVKRNSSGDVAAKKLALGDNGSEVYLDTSYTKCIPSFKDGITGELMHLLTPRELPIETGTFTPVCKQQGGASWTMDTALSHGKYYRIGNLVYVQGRARTTAKPSVSGGKFVIAGLPFTVYNSGQNLDLGIHSGLVYHDSAKELKIYLQSGTSEIQFYYVRTEYSYQVQSCDLVKPDVDIYFNGWYRCAE